MKVTVAISPLPQDGSKEVLKGKPTASRDNLLKPHRVYRGAVKKIAWDHGILPSTKDKILELLLNFVNQFLSGAYCSTFLYLLYS